MTRGRAAAASAGAESKITIAPFAGPFRVTSQPISEVIYGTLSKTITWDVAGTDVAPINVANVKLSLVGENGSAVIAESTPNDGSWTGAWPDVAITKARVKVEAVGNVFFDVSDADLTSVVAPTAPVGGTVAAHAVPDPRARRPRSARSRRASGATTTPRRPPTSSRRPATRRSRSPTRAPPPRATSSTAAS